MNPTTVFAIAAALLCLPVFYLMWIIAPGKTLSSLATRVIPGCVCLWAALTLGSYVAYLKLVVPIPALSAVVTADYKVIAEFKDWQWVWKWDERLSKARVISYARRDLPVEMEVSPITDNPKVRQLRYNLVVRVGGSAYSAAAFDRQARGFKSETDWLRKRLYEFNEQKSRELAKFYNPLEEAQQREFYWMVHEWIRDDLTQSGSTLERTEFILP